MDSYVLFILDLRQWPWTRAVCRVQRQKLRVFLRPEKSDRRNGLRSRDLEVPAIAVSLEIQVMRDFWVMAPRSAAGVETAN